MIGVFDSGHGGLTIVRELVRRFPDLAYAYLGDHANVPYGERASDEIVALTRQGWSDYSIRVAGWCCLAAIPPPAWRHAPCSAVGCP